jgi:aarF domain-containing kinase
MEAAHVQDRIPEGVDTAIFRSRRAARLLGGRTQGFKERSLEPNEIMEGSVDHASFEANKNQNTSNVRTTSESHPATTPDDSAALHMDLSRTSAVSEEDVKDLAQDISKDVTSSQVKVSLVPPRNQYVLITDSDPGRYQFCTVDSSL